MTKRAYKIKKLGINKYALYVVESILVDIFNSKEAAEAECKLLKEQGEKK